MAPASAALGSFTSATAGTGTGAGAGARGLGAASVGAREGSVVAGTVPLEWPRETGLSAKLAAGTDGTSVSVASGILEVPLDFFFFSPLEQYNYKQMLLGNNASKICLTLRLEEWA